MPGDERRLTLIAQEIRCNWHRAAGVNNVNDRFTVMRCNFDCGVSAARRGTTDQQRQFETMAFHLAGHMHHLVKRGRNQSAQPDQVRIHCFSPFENFFAWNHHSQVDYFVVVAGEDYADDVLTNIVNVTLDRRENDFPLRLYYFASRSPGFLLRLHIWGEMCHSFLHHACRFHHLRQEHLACSKKITHNAHAGHQGSFDHCQWTSQFDARFLSIGFNVGVDALHQSVRNALLDRAGAPCFGINFLFVASLACAFQPFAVFHQTFGGIRATVQEHIFDHHL